MRYLYYELVESHLKSCIKSLEITQKKNHYNNNVQKLTLFFRQTLQRMPNNGHQISIPSSNIILKNTKKEEQHNYSSRICRRPMHPIIFKKSTSQRAFLYASFKLHNAIPDEIKKIAGIWTLKKKLKSFLFQHQRNFVIHLLE